MVLVIDSLCDPRRTRALDPYRHRIRHLGVLPHSKRLPRPRLRTSLLLFLLPSPPLPLPLSPFPLHPNSRLAQYLTLTYPFSYFFITLIITDRSQISPPPHHNHSSHPRRRRPRVQSPFL